MRTCRSSQQRRLLLLLQLLRLAGPGAQIRGCCCAVLAVLSLKKMAVVEALVCKGRAAWTARTGLPLLLIWTVRAVLLLLCCWMLDLAAAVAGGGLAAGWAVGGYWTRQHGGEVPC